MIAQESSIHLIYTYLIELNYFTSSLYFFYIKFGILFKASSCGYTTTCMEFYIHSATVDE